MHHKRHGSKQRSSRIPIISSRASNDDGSDTDTDEVIQGCLTFSFMNRIIWKVRDDDDTDVDESDNEFEDEGDARPIAGPKPASIRTRPRSIQHNYLTRIPVLKKWAPTLKKSNKVKEAPRPFISPIQDRFQKKQYCSIFNTNSVVLALFKLKTIVAFYDLVGNVEFKFISVILCKF